jgi:hypothetical protein
MDDTDDTCWTWPFWKFGLKRDDLFGSLHDQYNTIPSPILDPQAFHHDVYEISQTADSTEEFYRLLQDRKQQRLRELNETLESAALEIIANPCLIGTEQWQHAVQLVRTRSLDSLVRYYASYLPPDHPWYKSGNSASHSEAGSSVDSLTDSHGSFFGDEKIPIMDEPFDEYPSYHKQQHLAASPRSMTMCSDSSVASPIGDDHHDFDFSHTTPARTLSFSESEPDCCAMSEPHARCHCERDAEVQPTTMSSTETRDASFDNDAQKKSRDGAAPLPLPSPNETTDSETPTPKPESHSASFFADTKPSLHHHRRYRSTSPAHRHSLSHRDLDQVLVAHRDPRNPRRARLVRTDKERECSPAVVHRRSRRGGSPAEPATRIQKPLPETSARMSRPRSRKTADNNS